ncbi:MAG: ABC transporter permease [Dehalococcoidia bacterium]|nr:ABC transporter permease [Dehalococcoidia bacterium]
MKIWKLLTRNLKELCRDIPALGFLLAFPLLFMVIFGAVFSDAEELEFIVPGIIIFGMLIMIPTSSRTLVRDREQGYLSRLLTTPVRPGEFILGYALCMALVAVVQIIFFMLVAWLYGVDITGHLVPAFLIFLLTALVGIGIGMIVGSIARSTNQSEPLTWLFTMPLAALSGLWFQTESMSAFIRAIADIFPYSHAVDAVREMIVSGAGLAAVWGDVLFLAAWAVGANLLGIFFFARTTRR